MEKNATIVEDSNPRGWIWGRYYIGYILEESGGGQGGPIKTLSIFILCTDKFFTDLIDPNKKIETEINKDDDCKVDKNKIKIYERNGNYFWLNYSNRMLDVSKYQPRNTQQQIINSIKDEYKKYAEKNKLDLEPEKKFINSGWKNYYDFLNISTESFPETLDELKKICKQHGLDNVNVYIAKYHKYDLPEMPEEISKYGLSNILCLFEKKIKLIR